MPDDAERHELRTRLDDLLRQHAALGDHLHQGQRRFQRLARAVWRVQEDERRRFARELHDGVGQNLTALLRLIADARTAAADTAPALHEILQRAHALADATWQDTRSLSRLLRPQILDDLGLEPALRWLARNVGDAAKVRVLIEFVSALPTLDSERSTLVFRVVQEALANATRHAAATCITVRLAQRAGQLLVQVDDDGCGCDPQLAWQTGSSGRSSGLGGVRDRVQLFGGDVRIESRPGHGFVLTIELPLGDDATEAT